MRTSGEGRQRLIALMSAIGILVGGTMVAGRLSPERALRPETGDGEASQSPLSAERRETLRQLQKIVSRLRVDAREGNWSQIVATADKDTHRSGLLRALKAEALARQGKHDAVISILSNLYKTHADPSLYLLTDRRVDYERLIDKDKVMIDSNPESASAYIHAAWIASLDPKPRPDAGQLLQFAEQGVKLSVMPTTLSSSISMFGTANRRNGGQPDRADALRVLGATQFRLGKYLEAIENLKKSEAIRSNPHIWPFLSLSLRKLGRSAEADEWDQTLRRFLSNTFGAQARPTEFYIYLRELDAARSA